jgi:hypothetical protein
MRRSASVAVAVLLAATGAWAQTAQPAAPKTSGIKPCEELKQEIDAKLQAKGVKAYTLEIVANDQVQGAKVVGSCDGGTKKVTYSRK